VKAVEFEVALTENGAGLAGFGKGKLMVGAARPTGRSR